MDCRARQRRLYSHTFAHGDGVRHTAIPAIYGLEKTPEVTALEIALVEGDDLSQSIGRGAGPTGPAGLPLDEALPLGSR